MIATILIFISVLFVVVVVHEYGHYIAAKKSGMLVEEFGFGMGPKVFSYKKGETLYRLNVFPIGGFVKIVGENEGDATIPQNRQFEYACWYKKVLVLVAGVIGNVLLGFVFFFFSFTAGLPAASTNGAPTITSISPGSPAAKADLHVGDVVQGFGTGGKNKIAVIDTAHVHTYLQTQKSDVTISVLRGDTLLQKNITPTIESSGNVKIGLAIDTIANTKTAPKQALVLAYHRTIDVIAQLLQVIGKLISGIFHHSASSGASDLVGPIGIASELGGAKVFGFGYILAFAALISLNLAVLNILPFPALDGGRLFVVLIEAVIRRPLPKKAIQVLHTIGFITLLGLILILTFKDIVKLF
jgi:regulator of sigma E protease